MTVEPRCWGGGGGVSHPLQLTTGLVINSSVTTSPTLAGEHMLLIPKVSILSEQLIVRFGIKNLQARRFLSWSLRSESAAEDQTGEQYSKQGRIKELKHLNKTS